MWLQCYLHFSKRRATAAPITQVAFKKCASFTKYTTRTDGTTIDDAEDLDLVMSMYNLIKYSSHYSDTTGSLWFYWKDEATNFNADIANIDNFKSFKYNSNWKILSTKRHNKKL